jgi:outer membrane biosynthesis protein TonB
MKSARTLAVVMLLCMVAGCKHKSPPPPPPAAQAPILPPGEMVKDVPPPVLPAPAAPNVTEAQNDSTKHEEQKPKKTSRRRTKPAEAPQPTVQSQKEAAPVPSGASEPADSSPIGQLSTAGDVGSLPNRRAILEQITATENGLNGIKRPLSSEEQTTAAQVRTFLTKAKQSLDQNDLDGAHTLVTKAHVLLEELIKP